MITAQIVADSKFNGTRLTSYVLTYPRFIHSEFMTHREISRNSSSSRAIPVKKMIQDVIDNPAIPIHWGKNQSGMQAETEISESDKHSAEQIWLESRDKAVEFCQKLSDLGIHKQVANRILEPYTHMRVLASATDWDNFFALRYHKDADPNIAKLAEVMLIELSKSIPKELSEGDWHIPFDGKMNQSLSDEQKLKVAVARAARVSYNTFDGEINYEKDYELHDSLVAAGHFSPTEHVAQACIGKFGNFTDFKQYRKTFATHIENKKFDYESFNK